MKSAEPASYGTIIVIGGGCYGSYYVRQLGRASRAGAIAWDRVLVIDRNPECLVTTNGEIENASGPSPAPTLVTSDWLEFFRNYLASWKGSQSSRATDSIVPSPLMPHLLYDWVRGRAKERWPDRAVDDIVAGKAEASPCRFAVATVSHCHGAINMLSVT